jgi:hypothetical protein
MKAFRSPKPSGQWTPNAIEQRFQRLLCNRELPAYVHGDLKATGKYVDAFAQNVNWEEVNRRAEVSLKAS